jgi:hypothetical protein
MLVTFPELYHRKGNVPLDLRKILEGRQHAEEYGLFFDWFGKCVCGKTKYRKNVGHKPLSQWLTPEDEAFARVCLVNSWKAWADMGMGKDKSAVAKFQFTSEGKSATKYQGWTKQGIEAYNLHLVKVMLDRKVNGDKFDAQFLEKHQEDKKPKAGSDSVEPSDMPTVLSSDDIDLNDPKYSEEDLMRKMQLQSELGECAEV